MVKIVVKTLPRFNPLAKRGILLFLGALFSCGVILGPHDSQAAIGTTTQNWPANPIYSNAAYPSAGISYNAVAGSSRLLVVGISSSTTAVNQPQPTVTYGGVSMTPAVGVDTAATQQHTYLFYLPLGSSATADTGKTIVVSISGGTSRYCSVNAAVYTGVDQLSPVSNAIRSSNNTTASTVVGPFTAVVNSGERGISILNSVRSGTSKANAATITLGTTGHIWSQVSTSNSNRIIGALRTTYATTTNVNTTTPTQHTSSVTALNSTASITIRPVQGITVTDGSTVFGNKRVYVNDTSSTNVVVDTFSMSATSATTVTSITFTGNANTTSTNVSAIKIWRKVGPTLTAWEASDVLVGSAVANGGAVSMSVNESVSTATQNYIVTYDIASGASASTANVLTGTITAISPTAVSMTDTGALSASVYIYPTITLGTGSEPPAVRLWKSSSATRLDAFTLVHNSSLAADDDPITTVTVTMTPTYISGGTGGTISKIKLMEIVDDANFVYGTANGATTGDVWNIPTSGLSATSTLKTYYVRVSTADTITPSVTDTSGTITGFYSFGGTVTALAHNANYKFSPNDNTSQALIIDMETPIGPAEVNAKSGTNGGEIDLDWTEATDANGGTLHPTTPYIIRRSLPDGSYPSVRCTDGVDLAGVSGVSIDYVNRKVTDKGLIDTTGTRYYYRVCAKDSQGNVSDGLGQFANSQVTMICNIPPTIALTPSTQLVKSSNSTPFTLTLTNKDQGPCPDTTFNLSIVDEVGNSTHFNKVIPATVTVGTGSSGTGTPVGDSKDIIITGKPEANQLEQYKFAVQVSTSGDTHGAPIKTAQVTGILNDMPPIVHNSANMGMDKYGQWGQSYTCATCHSNSTTNIKGVFNVISTPIGRRNVVFSKTSSITSDQDGVFGNDQRTVNRNISNNVCSVCHHRTTQHQYSANKADLNYGNGQGVTGPNSDTAYTTDHHNSRDCVRCHTHNTSFRSITGVCGDCHGNKISGYFPTNLQTMVHDKITNALGNDPLNYGAHAIHNNAAKMTCAACHNTTNHGLETTAWVGDRILEMGFTISKDTFNGFNPNQSIQSGTFYGTQFLSSPYVWSAGPGTTIVQTGDYNASCSTYCHGNWPGNSGSVTTPIWVGTGQAACGTCHNASGAAPPTSGSHTKHAANFGAGLGIACSKCHGAFSNFTGVGHINGKVQWDLSAYPGATYNGSPANSTGAPAPTASANFATCNTLYCHSDVQGKDGNGTGGPSIYKVAKWGDPSTATCGSCHADPNTSGSHPSHENVVVAFDCHVCHDNGGTTSPLNHANGIIDFQFVGLGQNTVYSRGTAVPVGTGYGTCSTSNCHGRFIRAWGTPSSGLTMCDVCHGSATSPRGFYNTQGPDGTLSIYSAAIGVHDIHLQNPNSPRKGTFARFTSYAKGFSCRHCHAVPDGPFKSGHMDTALPAEVPFSHVSSIANTGKTKFSYYSSPSYSVATQTCSAVWCHGAGMNSNNSSGPYAGVPGSIQRQNPKWDTPYLTGNGVVDCVKCHALPPPAPDSSYIHYGQTMANCKECHTNLTSDGLGFKDKSLHVNGKIDGGCTNCHGYPPITDVVGAADGLATPAQGALQLGTAGAHSAHVLNANIGKKCQTCHNNYTIAMPSNKLEIGFNGLNGTVTSGTFTGYSNSGVHPNWLSNSAGTVIQKVTAGANVCSNLYCHGGGIWDGASYTLNPLGGGSKTTPNWEGGSADAVCGSCHGADIASVPTGGSHVKHALATGGGPGINCSVCHRSVTDMSHVDGTVSWYLDHDNPVIGVNATYDNLSAGRIVGLAPRNNGADYRNCNNVYCHSNVQGINGIGAPTSYATVKWGSGTLDCGSCHKNMATDGAATGSHVKHANAGASNMALSCGYCHQDGGSGSVNHADNIIYVNFTSYVGGSYSNSNRAAGSAAGYGTCSATFCHGTKASPAWGSGPVACNECHGASADRTKSPSWSGRHATHYNYSTLPTIYNETLTDYSNNTKYRFNCKHCHDADSTKHSLKPYSSTAYARVFFGLSTNRRGKYSYGAAQGATDNGFKYTAGSCNTSYCHSNGRQGAPLVTTLTWTTNPTSGSNCLYCHDGKKETGTSSLSPRHDRHMNPSVNTSLGLSNGQNCQDCHMKTIASDNTTILNKYYHVNGYVDYSSVHGGPTNYNRTTKVCSNVYCHSNGNVGAVIYVNMTGQKAWGGTTNTATCNFCHGRSNVFGAPDYAPTAAGTPSANLHSGHMSGLTDTTGCSLCHRRTASPTIANKFVDYSAGTTHLNGSTNIYFDKSKASIGTKANVSQVGYTVTCSQIVCHGQGTPQWGQPSTAHQCQKCHGSRSTAFQTFTSPQIAPGYGTDGTDTSMTKKAATDPRVGAHQRHLVSNAISAPVKCGECHVSVTNIRAGNHWNYSTATLTFSGRAIANGHTSPSVSRTNGLMQCSNTNCHSGKYNSGTSIAPFWNMTGLVKETGTTVAACTKCHAMPPSGYTSHPAALSDTAAISTIYGACGSCHNNLSSSASNVGNVFSNKALHVNGTINYVSNCNGCHAYDLTGGGTTWTPALNGGAGTGAHIKHIAFIKSRLNIVSLTATGQTYGVGEPAGVCGTCHTNTISEHDNGSRQITFGAGGTTNTMGAGYSGSMTLLFGSTNPSFSSGAKTCSNLACHYFTTPSWY